MLTREENELLCRVEGDAPMGRLIRRHWMPALLAEEIPGPDSDPVPLRLLGEDLVAFRDTDGRVGVMDRYCPHRRASLVFGRNEDCGLRCLYHGWKVDVEGNEAATVAGMRDFFETGLRPAIWCEVRGVSSRANNSFREVAKTLLERGYRYFDGNASDPLSAKVPTDAEMQQRTIFDLLFIANSEKAV